MFSVMARFCITAWVGLMLAIDSFGCAGQNVEGRWQGAFPLEGSKECELRLESNHAFTVDCDEDAVVGGGQYTWNGRVLGLDFSILTYAGKIVGPKPAMEFEIVPGGNQMVARRNHQSFVWTRRFK
jgi:hypothetical protein